MASREGLSFRRCLARAKKKGSRYSTADFSDASLALLKEFDITENKRRQLLGFMQQKVAELTDKEFERAIEPELPKIVRKNTTHADMVKHADRLHTAGMSKYVMREILRLTGMRKQREVYAEALESVTQEFVEVCHGLGMGFRVRPLNGLSVHVTLPPYRYLGKTNRYDVFLKKRERLKRCLFTHSKLMQNILKQIEDLPEVLINIGGYRKFDYELKDLWGIFFNELTTNWNILKKFHFTVSKMVRAHKNLIPKQAKMQERFLNTANVLLSCIFNRIIRCSIHHIIKVTGDEMQIPFLKLHLSYEDGLVLFPNAEDMNAMYEELIYAMLEPRMLTMNCVIDECLKECAIPFYIEEEFQVKCLNEIFNNVNSLYAPVNAYVAKLEETFWSLYPAELPDGGGSQLEELERVDACLVFIDQIDEIVTDEYYPVGVVKQEDCKDNLKASVWKSIQKSGAHLVRLHQAENEDICREFLNVAKRAKKIPKDSAELMEQGEYMAWAATELRASLTERIQQMLSVLVRLLDFSTITWEHMQLNGVTVGWLKRIKIALDQHSSIYETYRFQFEERLVDSVAKLKEDIAKTVPLLSSMDYMNDSNRAREYITQLANIIGHVRSCERLKEWINKEERTFKYPLSAYEDLEELKNWIYSFYHLVKACKNWNRKYYAWMDGPLDALDPGAAEQTADDLYKEFIRVQKMYRNKLKRMAAENNPLRFMGSLEDPDPLNQPAPLQLCRQAMQQIKDFRPALTVMSVMCNTALLQRHWDEMSEIAGFDITPNAGASLRKMMLLNLGPRIDNFEVVSTGATKELQLITNLKKMIAEWDEIKFKTSVYKDTGYDVLTALDDIQVILDDHILKTLTMRGSVFAKPYEARVKAWYEKLTRINATIDEWGKVQAQWLYMLPIFSSKDIVAQMPVEGILFKEVDSSYKRYMHVVMKDPRVAETAGAVGLLEVMLNCSEMLQKINEGVAAYLEKKRLYFPRFFFLSNDEMLEILSETEDPLRVQPHLRKCFEAINKLQFDEFLQIHGMRSQEEEFVRFSTVIKTKEAGGSVEKWLVQVEKQMLDSILEEISLSWTDYAKKPRTEWIQDWPGQVVLAVSQVYWTADMHLTLRGKQGFVEHLNTELQETVGLVRKSDLSNLARITIKALIVIDVHAKDVSTDLQTLKSDNEFKWLCQMRYYWEEGSCLVRVLNASVRYACEYLGNTDRLVITPLTDRCYRTLVGAYHLHLNGAPEGPAGTGKTETTKDLAKALAVQCVVFNCSDGLDYKAMGKFFKGLASTGAWACFDEFNRIDIEVLSVVAQQILCIIQAVRANAKKFIFEATELLLNPTCYVCITMNPGYAGRSELPDNLKVLFRTVAMMVPDYAMIGEISLYSYGFTNARVLSVKIVTTYRLCSEQLSSQNHYDYGMRAVKSVLSAAGNNKRAYPQEDEDVLLLRSILDVNLAKFLSHDVPLFEGIISDLFPGVALPRPDYEVFVRAVKEICANRNLQPRPSFILKVVQTYEMMVVRHGFMVVGEPFAGKTSTLKVLAETLTTLNELGEDQLMVQYQYVNPKSVTMGQLYGQFDPVSFEWFDGIVATYFRNFSSDQAPDRKWIIFDGPVDAVWVENLNTVLDDSKKLCLISGEVMAMTGSMSMIFEVMDLSQASPATVSRCGMIYMEAATLGWRPFVESWIFANQRLLWCEDQSMITDIFEWLVDPCLHFIKKNCRQLCAPGEISLVKNTYQIVEMVLNDACENSVNMHADLKYMTCWLQAAFIYAGVWGLGGILDKDSREKFDQFYRRLWAGEDETHPYPPAIKTLEIHLPHDGLLVDHVYMYRLKGAWTNYQAAVHSQRVEDAASIQQVLVPTVDTAKYIAILDMHVRHKVPLLLVGPTGTGKSFYIQDFLMNRLNLELHEPSLITFTVKITANQTQDLLISKLHKLRRGSYGAPKGMTSVVFVDDVNMPAKEVYGAQPPIELLRQFFDHKNWYDLKDTSPIYIRDLLVLGAMGLVGGSRQDVYARFLRHFSVFSINEFSEESMKKIFSNILLLGLKKNGFPSDIINTVKSTVSATLDVYSSAINELRPTPAKSHYIFNLRDFARVIFGCAMLRKDSAEDKRVFAKIWVHEILRVFYDRLVDRADSAWLYQKLRVCVRDHFKEKFDGVFDNLQDKWGRVTEGNLRNLLFGTYLDLDATEGDVRYEEVPSFDQLYEVAMGYLEEYNATHKSKMEIVLFQYALEHLSRISRILSIPSGSALLVGVSGSGRQSLTKLATAIAQFSFFQPEISNNYGITEWRDDLKMILKESGGRGKSTTFLFAEGQIKEESFLQDIDCLLNSGEVPNIFPVDEKQEVLEMVRLAAQGGNRNLDVSALLVFSYFIKRCKEKLHIVLCFSPIGSSFRNRVRMYPSLVNCCTIDWFEDWPEDSLERVADNWIGDINLEDGVKRDSVVACKHFHVVARRVSESFYAATGRKTYVTSASYLELIKSFTGLTNKKQNEIMSNKNRYIKGLEKLQYASDAVAIMQTELANFQPLLKAMTEKAVEMTEEIQYETVQVQNASNQVRREEKRANVQAVAAQTLQRECQADLAQAIPALEEAIQALNTLKPADINIVKSMRNPPEAVKLVMAGVCVMRDIKPDRKTDPNTGRIILDFWGPSKKLLGEMNFLQALKDFDKDNIKPEIMAKIRKEFIPHKLFVPQTVAKASSAAEGLCKWIVALDMYDAVARVVAPKKAKLEKARAEYQTTVDFLMAKKEQLALLEERLERLNESLEDAKEKQQELQDKVTLCGLKLVRAEKLLGGLGGERSRWIDAANNLQILYDSLAGDILISCGVIAYLAPYTLPYRTPAVNDWHKYVMALKIPCSRDYDFATILGSEIKLQTWCIDGLPRDAFSMENAVIQDNSRRWSLLIDPQIQANAWIKRMERKNELQIVKFSNAAYMRVLENCVQFGKPALIENIEEDLEAPLDPLLRKTTFSQGGVEVMALGDDVIPFHENFKLYLTSNLRKPHYLPEVLNKVTVINFALTLEGLEDQLLGIVVAKERPDLQRQKEDSIKENAENKAALATVEDNILKTMTESKGDILEDEDAIKVLDYSKSISVDIIAKQKRAKETEIKIEAFRMDYKPIAQQSAVLYYSVSDLPNVDPMYQFSLEWFINLYVASIDLAHKSRDLDKRLRFLKDAFTYHLYANVCRSLFEKDKLMFSFVLCTIIMIAAGRLQEKELKFLLTGGITVDNPEKNPEWWLPDRSWDEICRVDEVIGFGGFRESFEENAEDWKRMYDAQHPEKALLPQPWRSKLNKFQRLIVVRLFRPDKIYIAISNFVSGEMGSKFITPPPFDIANSYEESTPVCPLIFILSPGNDPMESLAKFAEEQEMTQYFNSMSLGQGQGPIAQELIQTARESGGWVCLQNCHLAVSWMPSLENLWEGMELTNTHPTFRLWLTSYPSDKFPISILQYGVKMTNEPPSGLQQNLLRSYTAEPIKDESFYAGCPKSEVMFTRLLYGIAFFHAVVQERRSFGPLGWNIPYGFNESDLHISIQQLQMFINEYGENAYEAITYLTGECNYGGRVTDDWDRRLIVTILADFVNTDVVNQPDYQFVPLGAKYALPKQSEHAHYLEHIKALPRVHPPEVFGLHRNAGITRDLQTSTQLLSSMILVQGEGKSAGGPETDDLLMTMTADILSKIPPAFDLEEASSRYPVAYSESMNTVLVQEMERFNKLLDEMRSSLRDVQKAVKGLVIMTPALELLSGSLLLGRIPASWAKLSYPSLKSLPNYVADFVERMAFLENWYEEGKPVEFWLSGFFFTQAFLTGAKQNFARKYTIPIDQLTFDFDVLTVTTAEKPPEDGILVYGLYTDGARWDINKSVLRELYPKILYDSMPLIWLVPVMLSGYSEKGRYRCPLYKTSERRGVLSTTGHSTNYVLPFLLGTDVPSSHWVKRSVALLCQLD